MLDQNPHHVLARCYHLLDVLRVVVPDRPVLGDVSDELLAPRAPLREPLHRIGRDVPLDVGIERLHPINDPARGARLEPALDDLPVLFRHRLPPSPFSIHHRQGAGGTSAPRRITRLRSRGAAPSVKHRDEARRPYPPNSSGSRPIVNGSGSVASLRTASSTPRMQQS